MEKNNGFKVIRTDEKVIGQVVEICEDGFKVVKYYMNENNTYSKKDLVTFFIKPQETSKDYWNEFKKELAKHTKLSSVYLEESVVTMLNLL